MVNTSLRLFLEQPIAHRGVHGAGRPENSIAAIQAAIDKNVPLEVDVSLTRDNKWVLGHWPLFRNGSGKLKAFAYSTKHEIQNGWPQSSNQRMPTLPETFDLIKGRIPLLLDVKIYSFSKIEQLKNLAEQMVQYQKNHKADVAVQSYNPLVPAWFNSNSAKIPKGWVVGGLGKFPSMIVPTGKWPSKAAIAYTKPDFLTVAHTNPKSYLKFLKQQTKLPLLAYALNSEERAAAITPYVDNIIQDPYPVRQQAEHRCNREKFA